MTCALYRHYDADGQLLYVGIALSPVARLSQHMSASHWSDDIATVTIERHETREDAEDAERAAIREEKPAHNIAMAVKTPVADVIAKIGEARLAAALGLGLSSVQNARTRGVFPASWSAIISDICLADDIYCPASAFSWRRPFTPDDGRSIVDLFHRVSLSEASA